MDAGGKRGTEKGEGGGSGVFLQGPSYHLFLLCCYLLHTIVLPRLFSLPLMDSGEHRQLKSSVFFLLPEASHGRGSLPAFCGNFDGFRMTVDNV